MEFITGFIPKSQQEVVNKAKDLAEAKNIQQKIFVEANEYAQIIYNDLTSSNDQNRLNEFKRLQTDDELEMIKFYLVLDFLESIGCKFTPSVFLNETRITNHYFDKQYLEERLKLRTYDKTPMLVQLIEEIRKWNMQIDS